MPLWISFALLAVGLGAIFIELFVPAGGMIGIAGTASIIGAIALGYVHHGSSAGTAVLITALITTPAVIGSGFKIFPRTFVGRRLILRNAVQQQTGDGYPDAYADLSGKEGVALTVLRPSGMVRIDERKYSVVTMGDYIESGKAVRVVKTEGSRIVVRRIEGSEPHPPLKEGEAQHGK